MVIDLDPVFTKRLENSCLYGYQKNVTLTADAPLIAKSRYTAIGDVKATEMLADPSAQLGSKRTEHDFNVGFKGRHFCKPSNRPLLLLSIVHGVQASQGQVLAIRKCSLIEL